MESDKRGKEGSFTGIFIVMLLSLAIAFFWHQLSIIKKSVGFILNPTFGAIISWNIFIGFLITVAIITLILTLAQKYLTDQEELKRLKKEQKILNKKSKEFRHNPEKMMEFQKEIMPLATKTMKLSMRHFVYTGIPIILFFRWFQEILQPVYGGWWILYYLLASIIFSSIFRKILKVV